MPNSLRGAEQTSRDLSPKKSYNAISGCLPETVALSDNVAIAFSWCRFDLNDGCVLCEGPQGGVRLNLNRYTVSVASVTYTASSNPRPRLLIVCRCPRGLDDRLTAVQLVGRPRFHRALRHQRITENNNRQRRHCTLRCKLWQALEFSQFHLEDSC